MTLNIYAMENFFVRDTTSAGVSKRKDITQEVLTAAEVPGTTIVKYWFTQLINPEGLEVDFFVSRYW